MFTATQEPKMFHSFAGAVRPAAESWKKCRMPWFPTNRSAKAHNGGWQRWKCAWRSCSPRKKEKRSSCLIRSRLRKKIDRRSSKVQKFKVQGGEKKVERLNS